MKLTIPLILLSFFLVTGLSAQKRSGSINLGFTKKQKQAEKTLNKQLPARKTLALSALYPGQTKSITELIDTLNYPLEGEYAIYTITGGGGYVSGNNAWGDKAKVNVFSYGQPSILKGVLIDFAWATSGNTAIEIAAWDASGAGGSPGAKITTTTIILDDIFIDVLNDQTTYVPFESPVMLPETFYLGVVLPTGADTVALYTNVDGDTSPATAWEQWSDGAWYAYDDPNSWQYEMAHAIFPIVDAEVGLIANFFASSTAVLPGSDIAFTDTSIGGPISWSWSFEGGTPDTSDVANPVIVYNTTGLYNVQLIIGNGETFDTLLREAYILVTEEIPVETDTLIYPLPGVRTLYEIKDNTGASVGYVTGNNFYSDLAKANYYSLSEAIKITGLLVDFAVATGADQDIELAIWNNNGSSGQPGTKMASRMIAMNTIKSNVANNQLSFVSFDPPVSLNHPFYAGFILPTAAGDTLASWSNVDGDTFPGIAWDLWEDNTWVPISDDNSWALDLAMGIHPIVEYQTGITDLHEVENLAVYPNPTTGKFVVDLSSFSSKKTIELVDMTGAIIFSRELDASQSSVKLDLGDQYTGIYFVRVISSERIGVEKVVRH